MKYYIAVPTIVAYKELVKCIETIKESDVPELDVCIYNNGKNEAIVDFLTQLSADERFYYIQAEQNMGCSASWNIMINRAFMKGADRVLVINDDLVFADPEGIKRMMDTSAHNPQSLIIGNVNAFSAFVLTPWVYRLVGEFDEGFWPAYFEDNDYHYRCKLQGVETIRVEAGIQTEGSASIKTDSSLNQLNGQSFSINRQRYMDKWGGTPGEEIFLVAWDGKEPNESTKTIMGQ